MKWLIYAAIASSLAGAALWASSSQEKETPAKQEEELEEFVPTERVPADSSVSFPVDI